MKLSDSTWTIEDDELHIILTKVFQGELWPCVFKGHQKLNAVDEKEVKEKLMLERFTQEHPGFDFSDAKFNGNVPDVRSFMGGINNK